MYCVELGKKQWIYATALEAWHNKALEVRKSCPSMHLGNGVITGINNFEDFIKNLDEGAVLGYHALRVYKVVESEV